MRPDRSLFPGDDGFRFNHVLIRDVAYASMPKELRADLHVRLADWLEGHAALELTGHDEIVGYHLEQAYRWRAELGRIDEDARAAAAKGGRLLGQAGRRAIDRGESLVAAALLERACRLLEAEPAERLELLPDLGWALRDTGNLDAADAILAEAVRGGKAAGRRACGAASRDRAAAKVAFMRVTHEPGPHARRGCSSDRGVRRQAVATPSSPTPGSSWAPRSSQSAIAPLSSRRCNVLASTRSPPGTSRRQIEAYDRDNRLTV